MRRNEREWWERVTGTAFALTKHPTYTGITNHYFETAGAIIRASGKDALAPSY